jgi:hypothetical protein
MLKDPLFCRTEWFRREFVMVDLLIGMAFVAMVLTPAVVASVQRHRSHDGDL